MFSAAQMAAGLRRGWGQRLALRARVRSAGRETGRRLPAAGLTGVCHDSGHLASAPLRPGTGDRRPPARPPTGRDGG